MVPARALLTGQPALASWANFSKSPADRPGTLARTVRWMPVMPSPGWNVTSALVSTFSGGEPAPARACESAIE